MPHGAWAVASPRASWAITIREATVLTLRVGKKHFDVGPFRQDQAVTIVRRGALLRALIGTTTFAIANIYKRWQTAV